MASAPRSPPVQSELRRPWLAIVARAPTVTPVTLVGHTPSRRLGDTASQEYLTRLPAASHESANVPLLPLCTCATAGSPNARSPDVRLDAQSMARPPETA